MVSSKNEKLDGLSKWVRGAARMLMTLNEKVATSPLLPTRLRGAMVARLTPDQKVACSNHVKVRKSVFKEQYVLCQ